MARGTAGAIDMVYRFGHPATEGFKHRNDIKNAYEVPTCLSATPEYYNCLHFYRSVVWFMLSRNLQSNVFFS